MSLRTFDLNIEEVLENWEIEHAIREIIANAIDERKLSNTKEIKVYKDTKSNWHIRDYGRGIRIENFTMNENDEKIKSELDITGKFGVGLKDALATFNRHGIRLIIGSKYGKFRLKKRSKHGFDDIETLHIEYDSRPLKMQGTEFVFNGASEDDIRKARNFFIDFSDEEILEYTEYGQILRKNNPICRIYINGVAVADEPNFLFSYNIVNLTKSMKKKLNRERVNVGRSMYTERVKSILRNAKSEKIKEMLIDEVKKREIGNQCDEIKWTDINHLALKYMSDANKVVYFTQSEVHEHSDLVDDVYSNGYDVVVVSEEEKNKIRDEEKKSLKTIEEYSKEYNDSFQYNFIDRKSFTEAERQVFDMIPEILSLIDKSVDSVPNIMISELIRVTGNADGVWDATVPAIVIKRSALSSIDSFSAVLLHEIAHAATGTQDKTREFENVLTDYLGLVVSRAIEQKTM